jgi:uncharacterized protein YndB with AHSA1/START domain
MKTMELILTRSVSAPPEDVYDAWLDTKAPGSPWFGIDRAIIHPVSESEMRHPIFLGLRTDKRALDTIREQD